MTSWIGAFWRRLRGAFGGAAGESIDPDVRDVFLSELDEVTEQLEALMPAWRADRTDAAILQDIRRAFHTIKGSGQTVGARSLGDFSGRMEKLALQLIERRSTPSPDAIATIESAVRLLTHCSKSIRDNRPLPAEVAALSRKAQEVGGRG